MASLLILALYAIIILSYLALSFFIVYHLANYAINSELKIITLIFFIVAAAGLLVVNVSLFFSINWNSLAAKFFS